MQKFMQYMYIFNYLKFHVSSVFLYVCISWCILSLEIV